MRKSFMHRVRAALRNPVLQDVLERNAQRRMDARQKAFVSLPHHQALRQRALARRKHTLQALPRYIEEFVAQLKQNGWQVHLAANAEEACRLVVEIASQHGAAMVAKSKSMLSEEIDLNPALQRAGIQVVETDLGEYIVQLRGEKPSHIITPAVHLRREDVAATFAQKLGMPYTTDVAAMTAAARQALHQVFLTAPLGISGVNFGVAESGTLALVTNEGNGRMVTTVPPVHVALMGMERIVPNIEDLALMLRLLPRSATGQKASSYVTLLNRPRGADDPDGPEERILILVDNGRSKLLQGPLLEGLACIRCGACLNACPVFREIGGHSYGSPYPGPIGAVISPGLFGERQYGHLAKASTLCGACLEVCPVMVDLPALLLHVRQEYVSQVPQKWWLAMGMSLFARLATHPRSFHRAQTMAAALSRWLPRREGWLSWLPAPLAGWTSSRHFPPFVSPTFRERWRQTPQVDIQPAEQAANSRRTPAQARSAPSEAQPMRPNLLETLAAELQALGAEFIPCTAEQAPDLIATRLSQEDVQRVLSWKPQEAALLSVVTTLERQGVQMIQALTPHAQDEKQQAMATLATAQAGLTGAAAGIAETGTLILPAGPGCSSLASLLPPIHVALLRADAIYPDLESWLRDGGVQLVANHSSIALVSGPSRTADVEMTLTIGVHGPAKLLIYCIA
jgi:L-lactate dehydrogenase complex protein LldF